jgi:hypothetical protein
VTDKQIAALLAAAENRAAILHASAAWGSDEDGYIMNRLVDVIEAQVAEIGKLAGLVRGWHYLAVGPDEMGDYHTQKGLIKASEPYAHPALKALAQETQP